MPGSGRAFFCYIAALKVRKAKLLHRTSIKRPWLIPVLFLLLLAGMPGAGQAGGPAVPRGSGGQNAQHQLDKPHLVLVSIDGYRWDYPDIHVTPAISRIIAEGMRAERLIPVFPTLTFPNHYSIATGLLPARHGLVANEFPDPATGSWYALRNRASVQDGRHYRGEPIWVTAENQGMVAAAFFFVGSEAAIGGVRPTHWRDYDKGIAGEERVDQVLTWLREPPATRPHVYTLYFEDVDDNSHWYGAGSDQAVAAIRRVDGYLDRLLRGIDALPHAGEVYVLVVSDHGQAGYLEDAAPLVLSEHIQLDGMTIVEGGSYAYLHFDVPDAARARVIRDTLNAAWPHGRAWLPPEAPASWAISDSERFPDVIVQPDLGHGVISAPGKSGKLSPGDHGWAPEAEAMHGIFLARGAGISAGSRHGPVRAVDVHPLMLTILGLQAPAMTDGDPRVLGDVLAGD
jgi:predicted AlkP superfamily pyrophosphatase or phosphodiesterase